MATGFTQIRNLAASISSGSFKTKDGNDPLLTCSYEVACRPFASGYAADLIEDRRGDVIWKERRKLVPSFRARAKSLKPGTFTLKNMASVSRMGRGDDSAGAFFYKNHPQDFGRRW